MSTEMGIFRISSELTKGEEEDKRERGEEEGRKESIEDR